MTARNRRLPALPRPLFGALLALVAFAAALSVPSVGRRGDARQHSRELEGTAAVPPSFQVGDVQQPFAPLVNSTEFLFNAQLKH